MSFDERVDVVDMILGVLKEHERNLDTLVSQLGETLQTGPATQSPSTGGTVQVSQRVKLNLRKWFEFRDKCLKPEILAFDLVKDQFAITTIRGGFVFSYSETVPEVTIKMEKDGDKVMIEGGDFQVHEDPSFIFNGKLQCGLPVKTRRTKVKLPDGDTVHKIIYDVDPEEARIWLSEELKADKRMIFYGSIDI